MASCCRCRRCRWPAVCVRDAAIRPGRFRSAAVAFRTRPVRALRPSARSPEVNALRGPAAMPRPGGTWRSLAEPGGQSFTCCSAGRCLGRAGAASPAAASTCRTPSPVLLSAMALGLPQSAGRAQAVPRRGEERGDSRSFFTHRHGRQAAAGARAQGRYEDEKRPERPAALPRRTAPRHAVPLNNS